MRIALFYFIFKNISSYLYMTKMIKFLSLGPQSVYFKLKSFIMSLIIARSTNYTDKIVFIGTISNFTIHLHIALIEG